MQQQKQLQEATGLKIKYIQPDHNGYYDAVGNAFNSDDTMPDVCQLSSEYYSLYASNGLLWDMTCAYENSDLKKSGRLKENAESVIQSLMVNGPDGKQALYGFSAASGNGCQTYIKKQWLDACGIPVSDIENKVLDFNTFYGYCKKMADIKGHTIMAAPGFIAKEVPYTNYLPEFYQNAQYTFYKDSTGKYVDGFTQQEMKDAIGRIATAVSDGVLDRESVGFSTSNVGDRFKSKDPASETGVYTYWAGTWQNTLQSNLEAGGWTDSQLIRVNPVKELGTYIERIAPCWAITSNAKKPEAIFKYFIETMLDGGDVQTLWTYGAKGTHWDTKAEDVTVQGKEDQISTFKEGQFHMLPDIAKPTALATKNHIDPLLSISNFTKEDPGKDTVTSVARESEEFFIKNSHVATPLKMTEELSNNITDINATRNYVISQAALGNISVDEGMKYYEDKVGSLVKEVLGSLNK